LGSNKGEYRKAQYGWPASIDIAHGQADSPTLIHEIGHHVSATVDQNPHSSYSTADERGAEEGYAENFAERNFRDRRARPLTSYSTSHENWSRREPVWEQHRFADAFNKMRAQGPNPQTPSAPGHTQLSLDHALEVQKLEDPRYRAAVKARIARGSRAA
jgi:hypothetical protein